MKTVREKLKKAVSLVLCVATALSLPGGSGVETLFGAVTAGAAETNGAVIGSDETAGDSDYGVSLPHTVTINNIEGGTLTAEPAANGGDSGTSGGSGNVTGGYLPGETVTVDVDFDTNSVLYLVSVETAGGEEVEFWKPEVDVLQFDMPDDDVVVTAEDYYGTSDEFAEMEAATNRMYENLASVPALVSDTANVTMTVAGTYKYSNWQTHFFKTTYDDSTTYAYCVQPSYDHPSSGTYTAHFNYEDYVTTENEDFLKCIPAVLYISYKAPGWSQYKDFWPDEWYTGDEMDATKYYILAHIMAAALYTGDTSVATYGTSTDFKNYIWGKGKYEDGSETCLFGTAGTNSTWQKVKKAVNDGTLVVPDSFKLFVISTGNGLQNLVGYTYTPAYLQVQKEPGDGVDADLVSGNAKYSLEGAVYGVYRSYSNAQSNTDPVTTLTTGSDGKTETAEVDADSVYYVREISVPPGTVWELDETIYQVNPSESNTSSNPYVVTSEEPPSVGYLKLHKQPSGSGASLDDYPLTGARYTVYTDEDCTEVAKDANGKNAVLTVQDKDGNTDTVELKVGTYYVKETKTPDCGAYDLSDAVYPVTVTADYTEGSPYVLEVEDGLTKIPVYIQKVASDKTVVADNPNYSLKGATYGVYGSLSDAKNGKNALAVLTTDANGNTDKYVVEDGPGTYYVKELSASPGYMLDTHVYNDKLGEGIQKVEVTADKSEYQVTAYEIPEYDPLTVTLTKIDKETKESVPEGDASLAGAQFTIKFYAVDPDEYNTVAKLNAGIKSGAITSSDVRTWIIETKKDPVTGKYEAMLDADYLVSGSDELYYTDDGANVLPIGVLTIEETLAPEGYETDGMYYVNTADDSTTDGTLWFGTVSSDGTDEGVSLTGGNELNEVEVYEPVARGGLSVQKIDYMLGSASNHADANLSGAEFTIVNASENSCVNSSGKEIASSGLSGDNVTYEQVLAKASTCTMEVITSNASGFAKTAEDALPYGTYYVIETSPTHSEDPAVEQISVFLKKMAYLRWQGEKTVVKWLFYQVCQLVRHFFKKHSPCSGICGILHFSGGNATDPIIRYEQ